MLYDSGASQMRENGAHNLPVSEKAGRFMTLVIAGNDQAPRTLTAQALTWLLGEAVSTAPKGVGQWSCLLHTIRTSSSVGS